MGDFNPYLAWLDIGPHEHPIRDHRLLGLRPNETDPGVIAAAATTVLAHLEQFTSGPNAELGRRLMAEVAAARDRLLHGGSSAESPVWTERQIKAPPPVPMSFSSMKLESPKVSGLPAGQTLASPVAVQSGMAPQPASVSASRRLPDSASDSGAGYQATIHRLAPPPGSGMIASQPTGTLPSGTLPGTPSSSPAVTPVGVPFGTVVHSPTAAYSPPQPPPPAPPSPSPPAASDEGAWIPTKRSGRIGKSIGILQPQDDSVQQSAETRQSDVSPELQRSPHRIRRASRRKQDYVWAMVAVGGVCLMLLLIVLAIVAMNS
ncbi:MAG: hypothetical protein K8T91_16610 [Planctomycetes bacterium]|nr:hypothetical protein [Planctomycetota bacterium]